MSRTARACAGAMPCSISTSSASPTPRSCASRCAAATWNRLWLATPDAQVPGPLRSQRPVDEPQVGRVDLGLGRVRGLRPAVQLGLHLLHREVGALDQPHLEPGVPGPSAGDGRQLVERVGRVGQVRLQHDPHRRLAQRGVRREPLEHPDRQGEVAVLLHVEVEERAVRRGRQVQRPQPLDHPRDRAFGVPRGQLAGHGGDLDRHVVDVGPLDEGGDPGEPRGRLPLPQDRLTQQVQVQAEPVGARPGEVLLQPRSVVGHQVTDEAAQPFARGRHDDRRQHRPDA